MLNNTIIKKYIMLKIKHELNVLQWIPPIKGLVEFRTIKTRKNKDNCFKNKNIKNIIINLVESPKSTCSEYSIFNKSVLVKELLFLLKYFVEKLAIDFIILTSHICDSII